MNDALFSGDSDSFPASESPPLAVTLRPARDSSNLRAVDTSTTWNRVSVDKPRDYLERSSTGDALPDCTKRTTQGGLRLACTATNVRDVSSTRARCFTIVTMITATTDDPREAFSRIYPSCGTMPFPLLRVTPSRRLFVRLTHMWVCVCLCVCV